MGGAIILEMGASAEARCPMLDCDTCGSCLRAALGVTQMLPENHVSGLFSAVGNRNTIRFFRRREELYSSRLCHDFIAKESKTDALF